ncbi:MAG: macro domain-containing protein [Candidatus Asgardarchaeia archaeon]
MAFAKAFKINNTIIKVCLGDITKQNVDAIVNAANSLMIMGGGVAGAIKRAGGVEIEEEARKQAPVPVGSAIITTAGRLKAKYVIHAPTMERPAMRISVDNVIKATSAVLQLAEKHNISSLAIPAMGTGVGGVPKEAAADAMVSVILSYIKKGTKLREIILCDINEDMVKEFIRMLEKKVSS